MISFVKTASRHPTALNLVKASSLPFSSLGADAFEASSPVTPTVAKKSISMLNRKVARHNSFNPKVGQRRFSMEIDESLSFTSQAPRAEEEIVDDLITSKLHHGQVVMWTQGDQCIHSG